jgi:hypothetical protein
MPFAWRSPFRQVSGPLSAANGGTGSAQAGYVAGVWVPTLTTTGVTFDSVTYSGNTGGLYVRIGRLVHIQGTLETTAVTVGSATGNVVIGGLPFAAAADFEGDDAGFGGIAIGWVALWGGDMPSAAGVNSDESYIELFYRTAVNGATVALATSDVGTDNIIRFGGTYMTDL